VFNPHRQHHKNPPKLGVFSIVYVPTVARRLRACARERRTNMACFLGDGRGDGVPLAFDKCRVLEPTIQLKLANGRWRATVIDEGEGLLAERVPATSKCGRRPHREGEEAAGARLPPRAALRTATGTRTAAAIWSRRASDGVTTYSCYAPMALAVIGSRRPLKRFNDVDPAISAELGEIHRALGAWSRGAALNNDPQLPPELHDRAVDNWRPLISIADACGHEWGKQAREAAIALSAGLNHEDPGVTLLADIRQVFEARGGDRIFSQVLVDALVAMEGALWSEWRGKAGNRKPRPLTQGGLADMLHDFDITPMSIWQVPRMPDSKSRKGYLRRQFEAAWAAYCHSDDERPAQGFRVLHSA